MNFLIQVEMMKLDNNYKDFINQIINQANDEGDTSISSM
jgi:hypothetical protein